jgi:transcriptional regulator with XRE-family HTH domain
MSSSPESDFEEVVARLAAKSPDLADALEEGEPAFQVTREILRARREEGISQAELARRMGTTQSVVSRLERMEGVPNLRTVFAAAKALGRTVELRFVTPAAPKDVAATSSSVRTIVREEVQTSMGELMSRLLESLSEMVLRSGGPPTMTSGQPEPPESGIDRNRIEAVGH